MLVVCTCMLLVCSRMCSCGVLVTILEINMTYANDESCAEMVSVTGNVFKDDLTDEVTRAN